MAKTGMLDVGDPNKYRYNLQSEYNVQPKLLGYNTNSGGWSRANGGMPVYQPGSQSPMWDSSSVYQGDINDDPDVAAAKNIANLEQAGRRGENNGFSYNEQDALLNSLKSRINAKNNLGLQIAGAQGQLNSQLEIDKYMANRALGEGLRNTRQNLSQRGALYSDARAGAEQGLRNRVSSQLKSTMAADTSEYQSGVDKAKEQYTAIQNHTEAQNLNIASQAIEINMQNQIARAQAFQQLGQGVGYAAGTVASLDYSNRSPAVSPTSGWNPAPLDTPGLLNNEPFFGYGPRGSGGGGQVGWYQGDNYTGPTYGGYGL